MKLSIMSKRGLDLRLNITLSKRDLGLRLKNMLNRNV